MSWKYSIVIRLDAPFNKEVIQTVLSEGLRLDIAYYKFGDEEGELLDVDEATSWSLEENEDIDPHSLAAKVEGVYADLNFINNYGNTTLLFSGISHERLKKFKYGHEDIDIARYAKILLDITQDFRILEMHIEKS